MEDREVYFKRKRQEETEAIKRLDPDVIARDLDIPIKWQGTYYLGRATWRGDKNPSLSIQQNSSGHWLWHDFGTNRGGSWIDLYMEARGMSYVEARNYLLERFLNIEIQRNDQTQLRPQNQQEDISTTKGSPNEERKEPEWKRIGIEEVEISEETQEFLARHRGITHIPSWLKEIRYQAMNIRTGEVKEIKAHGIQDIAGNWHVRYAFKNLKVKELVLSVNQGSLGSTYSLIQKGLSEKAVITEGFMDAIWADLLWQDADLVILNGIENYQKVANVLNRYKVVYVATDTDQPGQKVAKELAKYCHQAIRVKFASKDLDEAMRNNEKITYEKMNDRNNNLNLRRQ